MKVRRRHAWGAALIALFALPVLRPDGVPFLERPVGGFFAWFGSVPALNPWLWGSGAPAGDGAPTVREQALAEENAWLREQIARRLLLEEDLGALRQGLEEARPDGLDRMPRALSARVLRTTDAAGHRRSLLIDRGEEDGLVPGLAVVSGLTFLGRVDVVQGQSALVKLVTDRQSRLEAAVRTDRGRRLTGFVRGEGRGAQEGRLELRFLVVPDDAGRLLPGAPLLTSNSDPLVPPA